MDPHRIERVSEIIREELEELIGYEMSDPRMGDASVVEVRISPDLRHAVVSLTLSGTTQEQGATLDALEHAKHYLRHQLTERLRLFKSPELHFVAAVGVELGVKTAQMLKRIRRGRPKAEENPAS